MVGAAHGQFFGAPFKFRVVVAKLVLGHTVDRTGPDDDAVMDLPEDLGIEIANPAFGNRHLLGLEPGMRRNRISHGWRRVRRPDNETR